MFKPRFELTGVPTTMRLSSGKYGKEFFFQATIITKNEEVQIKGGISEAKVKDIIEKLRDQAKVTVVVDVDPVPPTDYELERKIVKKTYRFRDLMA